MKKIFLLILTLSILTGCSAKQPPAEKTPTPTTAPENLQLADKLDENVYAGRVTSITDTEITIIMDERIKETFTLNDRAKEDIRDFEIAVDSRIVVKFVSPEDRTITAIEIIRVE